uniref:Uncharacterized protein n=1 Tax=Pyxicephalus adspersus TaxID=30357 RepID=A0AAV3AZ48_PYXAD|nr:TPA: hypothetical protein GDO54_005683 [Pyxicephalus adspersus]
MESEHQTSITQITKQLFGVFRSIWASNFPFCRAPTIQKCLPIHRGFTLLRASKSSSGLTTFNIKGPHNPQGPDSAHGLQICKGPSNFQSAGATQSAVAL